MVSDSENAIRACAGYTIKGSADLCEAIHKELAGRTHTTTFIKVVSHPQKKGKQPNWAHWGNDVVDNLAAMGSDLPAEETWDTWRSRDTEVRPVPRTSLGAKYFHKADQVCQPIFDFTPIAPSEVQAEYGGRKRSDAKNTLARLFGGMTKNAI